MRIDEEPLTVATMPRQMNLSPPLGRYAHGGQAIELKPWLVALT